jgi:hypothetical protein
VHKPRLLPAHDEGAQKRSGSRAGLGRWYHPILQLLLGIAAPVPVAGRRYPVVPEVRPAPVREALRYRRPPVPAADGRGGGGGGGRWDV